MARHRESRRASGRRRDLSVTDGLGVIAVAVLMSLIFAVIVVGLAWLIYTIESRLRRSWR